MQNNSLSGWLARAREAADGWVAEQERGVPVPDQVRMGPTGFRTFRLEAFTFGFIAGADQAEAGFAIERATGQRQLDDAHALMAESAALFQGYAAHHRDRAEEAHRVGNVHAERLSLQKARANMLACLRLREWMAGEDRYSVSVPGEDSMACRAQPFPIPAEIAANGDLVPIDSGKTLEDCRDRFGNTANFGGFPVPNVRAVTDGPLAEPGVVQAIVEAAGGDVPAALTLATDGAFRLSTGDPRFNPTHPVRVNGFLYHPASEAI